MLWLRFSWAWMLTRDVGQVARALKDPSAFLARAVLRALSKFLCSCVSAYVWGGVTARWPCLFLSLASASRSLLMLLCACAPRTSPVCVGAAGIPSIGGYVHVI